MLKNNFFPIFKTAKIFLIFAFISFASINSYSQELDDRFLESLPESMRDDLKSQVEKGFLEDDEVELFRSDTTQLKNQALLEELQKQINVLENQIENDLGKSDGSLEVFGKKIFKSIQTTFSPINLPSAQEGYVLDFGDILKIQIEGKTSSISKAQVNRDGSLNIKNIGSVKVAGLEFNNAIELIKQEVAKNALGAQAYVSLESLKQIQVVLTGAVTSPGVYTLNGNANLIHALDVAGGVSDNGSYRKVDHMRNGKVVSSVDLYDIFIFGKNPIQENLRSGDSIYVHQKFNYIPVSGGVSREAIYEFLPGETVNDALSFAGGFSQYASTNVVSLFRYKNRDEQIIYVDQSEASSVKIDSKDYISIPYSRIAPKPMIKIKIEGMVNAPGEYSLRKGSRLSDIFELAGGLSAEAYPFAGALYREDNIKAEMEVLERIYKDTINFLASNLSNPMAPSGAVGESGIALILEEFQASDPRGRVIAEFDPEILSRDSTKDILLADNDYIVIPQLSGQIFLFGEFNDPGARTYVSGNSLHEYINSVGKLKRSASKELLIISPDGNTQFYKMSAFNNMFQSNYELYPGTIVYAPRTIGKVEGIQFASIVAPILSSLALSLASLNSIND
jgi:protein involved in polysaccharide export with SLBB domain